MGEPRAAVGASHSPHRRRGVFAEQVASVIRRWAQPKLRTWMILSKMIRSEMRGP